MATVVTIDFETRSRRELRKAGAYAYARDPSTEVICLAYKIGARDPRLWAPDDDPPDDLIEAVNDGAIVEAHNVQFEWEIWHRVCVPRYGWPMLSRDKARCTQAACAYRGIPLKLEKAAKALGLKHQKDMGGNRLLGQAGVSKPKKNGSYTDDFSTLQRVYDYCVDDVLAEEELSGRVGWLTPDEEATWRLDQIINARGVRIDLEAVAAAQTIAGQVSKRLTAELREITGGQVETSDQRDRILRWIETQDYALPDLTADTLDLYLSPKNRQPPPAPVRRVLEIRRTLAKASTKKLAAMQACVCDDGRARGLLQYHGATTGRWAGRLVQPQNFPRPSFEDVDPETIVGDIMLRDAELLDMVYGDAMVALADGLRPMFIAGEGRDLVSADFSAVESIVTAAVAGEESKLDVFRRGDDPYCTTASLIFGYPVLSKKTHPAERQVGKTGELAFGFQGGVGAWRQFDNQDRSDEEIEGYRDAWRHAHPNIVALWRGLNDAAVAAVYKKQPHSYRGVEYRLEEDGEWLSCRLLSGRKLWYYGPEVGLHEMPWDDDDGEPAKRLGLSYWAWRQGQWRKQRAYGGLLTENVVQATARDLMVPAMRKAEAEGYPVILTVHDELVTEPAEGRDHKVLEEIMRDIPSWARGWPVKAEGWTGKRYRK